MKKITMILIAIVALTITANAQWTAQSSGLTAVDSHNLLSVYFTDASTGYAVGKAGIILKTTNGGTNWTALTNGITDGLVAVYFTDANTGYATGTVILKTTDGGANWTNVYTSPYQSALRSVYFVNATTGYVVGAGIILKTTDGGTNWTYQGSAIDYHSVYFIDASTGYAVGNGGTIVKTTDGGINWTAQTSGTTDELYSVYFTDANTGCAVGTASTILKTTDGGTIWTSQTGDNTYDLYSVCFPDANTGYITGGNNHGVGVILKTTDGGTNWTINWTPTMSDQYYYSVYFPDINTGYAVGIYGKILKYSTSTATVVATEDWSAIMDNNSSNYFNHIFEKNSEGVITTTTKAWQYVYNDQSMGLITVTDLNARTGSVTINGTSTSFSFQGTATILSPASIAGDTSPYTFSTIGDATNGTATGTYTISFTSANWPSSIQGTFSSTKISGSGVTAELNAVNDITTDRQVILYPNPATDAFSVKDIEAKTTITVSDLSGRLLLSKNVTANETVSVSSLPNGIYLVDVKSNNATKTEKLIIQR
jgi:photosystem II stability/assembly factor-like uncharacterized protein